jgi:hypothetical protein
VVVLPTRGNTQLIEAECFGQRLLGQRLFGNPRVRVTASDEYETGKRLLLMSLQAYESRHWALQGPQARESEAMGDRIGVYGDCSGALDSFNRTICSITALASDSILNCPAVVNMEVDYAVNPSALRSLSNSPYRFTREAAGEAIRSWNALTPRQRSVLVERAGDLSEALQYKYEALHQMRRISNPDR